MNQNHFSLKILTVMLLSAYGGSFADGVVPVSDGPSVWIRSMYAALMLCRARPKRPVLIR